MGVKVSGEKWAQGALPEISIGTAMVTSGPMALPEALHDNKYAIWRLGKHA